MESSVAGHGAVGSSMASGLLGVEADGPALALACSGIILGAAKLLGATGVCELGPING